MKKLLVISLLSLSSALTAEIIIDEYSVNREKELNKLYEVCEANRKKDKHWGRWNNCRDRAERSIPSRFSDEYREKVYGQLNRKEALAKIKELQAIARKARETSFSLTNNPHEVTTGTIINDINFIRYKVLKDDPRDYEGKKIY